MSDPRPVPLPTLISLLICDQVIDDRLTNKKSLIGLFDTILLQSLPAVVPQVVILATLTEIAARTPLELRLVRDADGAVLVSSSGHVEAPTPLATVDLVFAMQGIQLSAAGQYAFELLCGGELLGRRRFQVVLRKPPAGPVGTISGLPGVPPQPE